MCTTGELVDFLTQQLNDDDETDSNCTWSRDLLRQYLMTAISATVTARPDLFTEVMEIELEAGCIHSVCPECEEFSSLLSVDGNDCAVEEEPSQYGIKLAKRFAERGLSCSTSETYDEAGTYAHGGVTYDKNLPCYFRTTNPVPARGVMAKVACVKTVDTSDLNNDEADLPAAVCGSSMAAVIEYAMYLALEKDVESEGIHQRQQLHFNTFSSLLNIQWTAEDRLEDDS